MLQNMSITNKIDQLMRENFSPESLQVINDSARHAGHGDFNGESHFKIVISAKNVPGNSRLEKHRAIIAALGDIMQQIHALNIEMN